MFSNLYLISVYSLIFTTPCNIAPSIERLLLNHQRRWDSWPPEEKNSTLGQRQDLITQSFCVIKFY